MSAILENAGRARGSLGRSIRAGEAENGTAAENRVAQPSARHLQLKRSLTPIDSSRSSLKALGHTIPLHKSQCHED